MIDPLPLTRDGATPFETLLLSAGRSDALSSHGRARIHLGLGLGGGALAASVIATGLKTTAAKNVLLSSGSAAVIGAVGAVALFFGARGFLDTHTEERESRSRQPAAVEVEAQPVAPARPAPVVAPAPALPLSSSETEPKPVTKPNSRTAVVGTALPSPSLANELNAIEAARRAMARREYPLALRLLDDYAQRFPKPRLGSEATLLRIETLAGSGSTDAAQRLGRSFLANHPNGPYARRVRSLLLDAETTAM